MEQGGAVAGISRKEGKLGDPSKPQIIGLYEIVAAAVALSQRTMHAKRAVCWAAYMASRAPGRMANSTIGRSLWLIREAKMLTAQATRPICGNFVL